MQLLFPAMLLLLLLYAMLMRAMLMCAILRLRSMMRPRRVAGVGVRC